jgi:predicted kinase
VVRAKVELIRSRQHESPVAERMLCRARARHYLDLACTYADTAAAAGVVVLCGPSGTGKSTVARALRDVLGFEIVSSDQERKRLAGIAPATRVEARYGEGIYSEDIRREVYRSLIKSAAKILSTGKGVIIDATFRHRNQRAQVAEAKLGVGPFYVECRADQGEVMRRLLERAHRADEVSDATVEIYLAQLKDFEPLDEIPPARRMVADTTADLTPIIAEVERRLYQCPAS